MKRFLKKNVSSAIGEQYKFHYFLKLQIAVLKVFGCCFKKGVLRM